MCPTTEFQGEIRMKRTSAVAMAVTAVLAMGLAGCGGSGTDERSGTVIFRIEWPQSSRLVPQRAQSVRIALLSSQGPPRQAEAGQLLAEQIIPRPPAGQTQTVVTFRNLPPGWVLALAAAYPEPDGSGNAQAAGSVMLRIEPARTTVASLTMESTIARIGVSPTGPLAVYVDDALDLVATAYDARSRIVLCAPSCWAWSVGDADLCSLSCSADRATLTGLADGATTVTVTEQESGRVGQVAVAVVKRAPNLVVSPTTLDFGATDTEGTFTVSNTGTAPLTWSCGVPSGADWVTGVTPASGGLEPGASETVTVTVSRAGLAGGTYAASLVIEDEVGGGAQIVDLLMTVINADPVINSLAAVPSSVPPGGAAEVTCVAHDPDGDPLTYSWTSLAGTISGTGATVTWTAPGTVGTYAVICSVTDDRGGVASASVEIAVTSANHEPMIEALTATVQYLAPGATSEITCTATDPDDDPLTYEWSADGGVFTGTGPTVTWTAPATAGQYTVACTVRDPAGASDSATLVLTVNSSPIIESLTASPEDVGVGGDSTITCAASDPDGDPLTYEWSADAGTISDSGASIVWTAPGIPGTYVVSCVVRDTRGGAASGDVSVYVSKTVVVIQ
jgi:hypothetical protein